MVQILEYCILPEVLTARHTHPAMFLLAAATVVVGAGNAIAMKQMANWIPSHMFFIKYVYLFSLAMPRPSCCNMVCACACVGLVQCNPLQYACACIACIACAG